MSFRDAAYQHWEIVCPNRNAALHSVNLVGTLSQHHRRSVYRIAPPTNGRTMPPNTTRSTATPKEVSRDSIPETAVLALHLEPRFPEPEDAQCVARGDSPLPALPRTARSRKCGPIPDHYLCEGDPPRGRAGAASGTRSSSWSIASVPRAFLLRGIAPRLVGARSRAATLMLTTPSWGASRRAASVRLQRRVDHPDAGRSDADHLALAYLP
jgi:hypothetical protein